MKRAGGAAAPLLKGVSYGIITELITQACVILIQN